MKYVPVTYVNDGMTVWTSFAPFCLPELRSIFKGECMVRCTVQVAAGYHARIVNEDVGIDQWVHIDVLRLAVADESAPDGSCGRMSRFPRSASRVGAAIATTAPAR